MGNRHSRQLTLEIEMKNYMHTKLFNVSIDRNVKHPCDELFFFYQVHKL